MITVSSQAAQTGLPTPQHTPKPRKKPHCSRCGKPMRGHKRGQCDTDEEDKLESFDVNAENALVAQLSSIDIGDENAQDIKTVRFKTEQISGVLARAIASLPEELMSLASEDKAALQALAKPGMLSNDVDPAEGKEKMERLGDWLETIETSRRARKGRPSAPPELPSLAVFDAILDTKRPRARSMSPIKRDIKYASSPQKSSSIAEREQFLHELAVKSKTDVTNVYRIDLQDVQGVEERAKSLKLHARVLAPRYKDGSTGIGWLVIGKDKSEVEETFKGVERDAKESSTLASTVMVATGAVACWLCLAFS